MAHLIWLFILSSPILLFFFSSSLPLPPTFCSYCFLKSLDILPSQGHCMRFSLCGRFLSQISLLLVPWPLLNLYSNITFPMRPDMVTPSKITASSDTPCPLSSLHVFIRYLPQSRIFYLLSFLKWKLYEGRDFLPFSFIAITSTPRTVHSTFYVLNKHLFCKSLHPRNVTLTLLCDE